MPGVQWTDASRTQLLLIIIHLGTPTKWDKVAELLQNGCTAEAARQQFKLLKVKAKKEFGEFSANDEDGEEKPKTPAKGRAKKARAETTAKSTSKRKVAKADDEEEVDDAEESPLKKVKAEVTKDENGENCED